MAKLVEFRRSVETCGTLNIAVMKLWRSAEACGTVGTAIVKSVGLWETVVKLVELWKVLW